MSDQLQDKLQPLTGQRQKGESDAAVQACNDWLRMGAGRSLIDLVNNYLQQSTFQRGFSPPSTNYDTLRTWSSRFKWADRATSYDTTWEDRKNEERERILKQELALDFGRLKRLFRLVDMLEGQLYERDENGVFHNLWVPDVKQVGSGEFSERVDIERYNSSLVSDYRAALDDIAKEVGGRVKKSETDLTSGGEKLSITINYATKDDDGSNDYA